ncbi:proteobacterial dedicated sortase system histidine kinase [Pseudohongiella sp. SYSU M77423]|uniref:proteobacterial dedicated sortase system histidine kinase n=1 Tax=Pseudohongiella sp. SYSU M77423 TaxID=3042312 RepID=UPI000C4BE776|nr:proteobacterial dedicated sortase system histidine kinase [Pseudohongiella sp. SYSU M77423]MAO40287.1 proteobacterial dedicated sortase system histidine kinase [Pseudohongiella sp.]MAY55388.1 proteobacterial dedicated sortase system histidine kinase [Gammaproteobacteria bacterium]MEC8860542.1 proteobacterial dedicated sortase system histidine kinase [Pseudomonadota bacterium]MBJ55508.1 proteobacterial dedicated sortase system histidine kinase [Gammaproteobacteria bacterium]MDH7942806.1 prot|tara:strand:- start:584827 stop:587028 length:2202 start_codon:yes stop_codon:yes gene_type:complete
MARALKTPFGIRFKLVFLSSFLLVIPWLGYQYILEMEDYLRRGQEQVVLGTARALATALNERPELFDEGTFSPTLRRSDNLYVYPIYYPLSLDDESLVDWRDYQRYELPYGRANTIATQLNPQSEFSRYYHNDESLNFRLLVGEHNRYLYAYLKVVDNQLVYRSPDSLSIHRSDFLQISLVSPENELHRYVISPRGPEFIYAYEIGNDLRDIGALTHEERISGQWYETEDGYVVELRLPLTMLGQRLGFAIYDVDDPETRNVTAVVATSDVNQRSEVGNLLRPTPEIDKIVEGMGHTNSRIQVVDRGSRVLLSVGDIQSATGLTLAAEETERDRNRYWAWMEDNVLHPLYYQILTKPSNDFIDDLYVGSTLEGAHLSAALDGESMTQFRTIDPSQTRILEAAYPIFADGEVMGAVVVDQNMNGLRTFRNQALETLFNTILGVMLLVAFGLFFFASRISARIRALRNQAENIIDDHGRLKNTIVASRNSDEIGDLSRSFYNMVERLGQYTNYLENMSSRLSHELRTPVTVVRSSLENLGMTVHDRESAVYIQRAEDGINRLNLILTNMSEATRLEQMLQTSEKERIDLAKVVAGCVEGYRLAYPDAVIEDDLQGPVIVSGVPEYIAQLMDKLIANAVEFTYYRKPITVFCRAIKGRAVLRVTNYGPYLPEEMKGRLFDSMISVRPQEKQREPHLGMGLHIARLITEFHQGHIRAENIQEFEGVAITLIIPLLQE